MTDFIFVSKPEILNVKIQTLKISYILTYDRLTTMTVVNNSKQNISGVV